MALTISGHNPIILTGGTGNVFGVQGSGGIEFPAAHTQPIRISRIRWVSPTAAANDACVLSDTDGNVIFQSSASGANWSDETDFKDIAMIKGLVVTTLSSGTVYVHLK